MSIAFENFLSKCKFFCQLFSIDNLLEIGYNKYNELRVKISASTFKKRCGRVSPKYQGGKKYFTYSKKPRFEPWSFFVRLNI
jgi:hypothetical protein